MNRQKLLASFTLVLALGAMASCSDDKKASSDTTASAADSISKADFLTQANALCATFQGEVGAAASAATTEADQVAVVSDVIVPGLRRTLTDIAALGFPEGDEELISGLIDETNAILDEVEADPASFVTAEDPFAEVNAKLVDYGLTVCGG